MSKLGWLQDVVVGVYEICGKQQVAAGSMQYSVEALLLKGFAYLKQHQFQQASAVFEEVLKTEMRCSRAAFGLFLCAMRVDSGEAIGSQAFVSNHTSNDILRVCSH